MKKQIFGRKVGSANDMVLLLESDGVSTGGQVVDAGAIDEFAVASARRSVQALRKNYIEGYVLFEGDPTRYEFTPDADFAYPASVH
ncbi:hypothetical protein [Burkholderia pyrrocinia]|uniref:hypothetical protein n=1 Tax=Burkholderia pyrrocinia TaxID=60550 RepID=UPI0010467598|nr:hypothetical protein [Burkholderia pyrrocinia]TDA48096.1 hypothetical protein EVG18_07355 [Burkholderia pyrrocinia]